ncbi:IS607 family transposase [Microcoleus sp. A2-C5]|uniref:IS607 family transposase n=1 Tax=Microcoleaceae TaxID=1892252 RepID=UPI002238E260|nr:IS607 family transposase [Lyngbya sp. CCAP 1446/10]MCW6049428.1 IS607 family transposase [Lyngbya sp. CCAP 1446/10]
MSKVSISEAAKLKGVSVSTLRRWEAEGKLVPERTESGHRRYDIAKLIGVKAELSYTIGYARVSSHDQKEDLVRQKQVIELFCATNGWQFETIEDLGSGMNYNKKGLKRLIKLIIDAKVERLVLTHKDRLLRFGAELIFSLCEHFGTEVVIINRTEDASFEEDLASDVLEIITVFSARLYGSRSPKNRKIVEELKEVAKKI